MKAQDKILFGFGMVIGITVVISLIVYGLYWLLGRLDYDILRWYAVGTTLAFPVAVTITYRLATHWAREHLSGFDRGITGAQKTVEVMGRSLSATASIARTSARTIAPKPDNSDLLPQVGAMRLTEATYNTDEYIDL